MTQRYPYVDVLRGLAALLVICYHVIEVGQWTTFPIHGAYLLPRVGWIGVDLFFVISGFVIGKSALEAQARDPLTWKTRFWDRRVRRIFPLYFATLLVYLFMTQPGILQYGLKSVWHVLSHVLMLHHFLPETSGSINGPNWSVALEVQFYALMLWATPWLARNSLPRIAVTWIGIALAWRYGSTLVFTPGTADVTTQRVYATQLPGVLDQFVLGILLAKLAVSGRLAFTWARLGVALAVTIVSLGAAWFTFWPRSHYWYLSSMIVLWRFLLNVGFAGLLAVFLILPGSGRGWAKPFVYLGEISYGLYLWHSPILMALIANTQWRGPSLLKATLIGTFIMAAMSWHFFEKLWMNGHTEPRRSKPS